MLRHIRVVVARGNRGFVMSNGSAMQLLCHLLTLCLFPTVTIPWSSIAATHPSCCRARKPRLCDVKWFGNATAVSSLDSLLVPNGNYSLEFNCCDTSELLSREETEALGVQWSGNATAVSSLDSLLVPNGDYSLEFNCCDTNWVNSCKRLTST